MTIQQDIVSDLPRLSVHSPLAVIGAFIYVVRSRFLPNNNIKWTWTDNKATTGILVEAQFEKDTEVRDGRPGIFIDRDQTVFGKLALGNKDQNMPNLMTKLEEQYWGIAQVDIIIDCISTAKGESAEVGDAVQQHINSTSRIIDRVFTFRDISPVLLGRTVAYEKQTDLFTTPVTFRVEYEIRWSTEPIAPVLRGLLVHLKETNKGVDDMFTDIYLKSLNS